MKNKSIISLAVAAFFVIACGSIKNRTTKEEKKESNQVEEVKDLKSLFSQGDSQKALNILNETISKSKDSNQVEEALYLKGFYFHANDDLTAAIDVYNQLDEYDADNSYLTKTSSLRKIMDIKENMSQVTEKKDSLETFLMIKSFPTLKECGTSNTDNLLRDCFKSTVNGIVVNNYDTSIGETFTLSNFNRIYVNYEINDQGQVSSIKSITRNTYNPYLTLEAERMVALLNIIKPAMNQDDEPMKIKVSLPITYRTQ